MVGMLNAYFGLEVVGFYQQLHYSWCNFNANVSTNGDTSHYFNQIKI